MSKNFGHPIDEDEAPGVGAAPATDDVRGKSTVLLLVGVGMLFTPLVGVGAVCVFVALLMLLCSPVLGSAERNGYEQARTGSATRAGCGLALGLLVALTVGALIAVLGVGALTMGGL